MVEQIRDARDDEDNSQNSAQITGMSQPYDDEMVVADFSPTD